jgi:L-lactate dehydrogenase (cytochrome)
MAENLVSVADMRRIAKRRLPRMVFDYLDGAALDEVTMRDNETDFERIRLRQRVLLDVSQSRLDVVVLGQRIALPVMIAPMGALTLFHPDADLILARAAARAGTIFVHSAWSGTSLEEVVKVAPSSTWAQIALWKNKAVFGEHLERAAAAGVEVLVVPADVSMASKRERDLHHQFDYRARPRFRDMLDSATKPAWLARFAMGRKMTYGNYKVDGRPMRLNEMEQFIHENKNPGSTWKDVEELRNRWPGKIVIKGVMTAEDSRESVRIGADAVIVSNMGGRHFDGQPSTIAVLPEVVAAADGHLEVFIDSGLRRGGDVAKCLALGANACLVGRPPVYGLAARGPVGVDQVFGFLREELAMTLGNIGLTDVNTLDKSVIFRGWEAKLGSDYELSD